MTAIHRPDIVVLMTDEERAVPPYESPELVAWRDQTLRGRRWFEQHGVSFRQHYAGSLACAPSRPTMFTGHYPDLHGVTQTDGLGKTFDDSRMRWLRPGEVPTLGNWLRAAGYDTHYDGKWHISHADLHDADGKVLATNDSHGVVDAVAVQRYLSADPLAAPPPRRRSGRAASVPVGGQFRQSARHRAVPSLAASQPGKAVTDGSSARARGTHRRRGSVGQAGRPDRVPAGLLLRLRPGAVDRADVRPECAALSRPVRPATRRGRRADRPGPPGGHRRRVQRCGAGTHVGSR